MWMKPIKLLLLIRIQQEVTGYHPPICHLQTEYENKTKDTTEYLDHEHLHLSSPAKSLERGRDRDQRCHDIRDAGKRDQSDHCSQHGGHGDERRLVGLAFADVGLRHVDQQRKKKK